MKLFRRKSSLGVSGQDVYSSVALVEIARAAITQLDVDLSVFTTLAQTAEESDNDNDIAALSSYLTDQLKSKRHQVILMTLLALEALFIECTARVHAYLAVPSIVEPMMALAERQKKAGHENAEISDKALDLIRSWGEGFRIQRDYGVGKVVVEAYKDLERQRWVQWPPKRTPLFNPNLPSTPSRGGQAVRLGGGFADSPKPVKPRKPASLRPGSLTSFETAEADTFRADFDSFDLTITAFETELAECEEQRNDVAANPALDDLALTCHRISPQLATIIEILTSTVKNPESVLPPFLVMNDRLNGLLAKHKKLSQKPAFDALTDFERPSNPFDDDDLFSKAPAPARAPALAKSASLNPFDDEDLL